MHMVNAAVLEEWTILPDEAVVSHVLDGQVALFEILMRRHNERLYRCRSCHCSRRGRSGRRHATGLRYRLRASATVRRASSFATWLTESRSTSDRGPAAWRYDVRTGSAREVVPMPSTNALNTASPAR